MSVLLSVPPQAMANDAVASFRVPQGDATRTLKQFARQAQRSIVFDTHQVEGVETNAVAGKLKPVEALRLLLEGTPLRFDQDLQTGAIAVGRSVRSDPPKAAPEDKPTDPMPVPETRSAPTESLEKKRSNAGAALRAAVAFLLAGPPGAAVAQTVTDEEETVILSPFTVDASEDTGYAATSTLAGTRIRTDLRDVGAAIQAVTKALMEDLGATDNRSLLQYTTGTEVGGASGNFAGLGDGGALNETGSFKNPSTNTRVRGLDSADNTRNFFLTSIPWDGYNIDRVDIQRGANSMLFGLGSPAGIINVTTARARFADKFELGARIDSEGSFRTTADMNWDLIDDQLAARIILLNDNEKFRQRPAFEDDRRVFATVRYEPKFLKKGRNHTTIEAYFEDGSINANRPRTLTPKDNITGFFRPVHNVAGDPSSGFNRLGGLGGQTLDPSIVFDNTNPNGGQNQTGNPNFLPLLGNLGQIFAGPMVVFPDSAQDRVASSVVGELDVARFQVGGSLFPFRRMLGIDTYSNYASVNRANLPLNQTGLYKEQHLSDRSIFDFYNTLLEGPNKSERQDWDNANLSLTQSFFDHALSLNLVYDKQDYFETQTSLVTNQRSGIYIDVNTTYVDGTPNPNVGRALITDNANFGNNLSDVSRETYRLTAAFQHDFRKGDRDSLWRRLLGRQQFTGLVARTDTDERYVEWMRHAMGAEYRAAFGAPRILDSINNPTPVIYVGPSLLGRSSAAGAGLTGLQGVITVPDALNVRYFDETWIAPAGLSPAAPWQNGLPQASNPANYVGWVNRSFAVEKADADNPAPLATVGRLTASELESQGLTLQNYFWDGAVVATYGWRKDRERGYVNQVTPDPVTGIAPIANLRLPDLPEAVKEGQPTSWSVVAHLNRWPLLERLPFLVSLYYNESENFKTAALSVDHFGRPNPSPTGTTVDESVLLATKNGRFSMRLTKYESNSANTPAGSISNQWLSVQTFRQGQDARNLYGNNLTNDGRVGVVLASNTYQPRAGQSAADAQAEEDRAVAGWDVYVDAVRGLSRELTGDPEGFFKAWSMDLSRPTVVNSTGRVTPAGLTNTQDVVSKGYELEFTARPTDSWDVTLNASKTEARRSNVGGEALARYTDLTNEFLNTTDAGNVRIFGSAANSRTTLQQWNGYYGNYLQTRSSEGVGVAELREWRVNLVTNYRFREGRLRGFNFGGAVRWEDEVGIGYDPIVNSAGTLTGFDLDNPYLGPSETNFDFWVAFNKKLSDRVNWKIQINVRNAFADKDLIPINVQPDGTVAAWRLAPQRVWQITNTFSF